MYYIDKFYLQLSLIAAVVAIFLLARFLIAKMPTVAMLDNHRSSAASLASRSSIYCHCKDKHECHRRIEPD